MDGNPSTFITLTVNPAHGQSPEGRARELVNAWRIVVKRARRKFTKAALEYLAVFEETKKGEPHLHIVCRAPYIPQPWLSEQMNELIEAPIVDIRRVGSKAGVAKYVAKYVAKGPTTFGTLKRYWSSSGYDLLKAEKAAEDHRSKGHWSVVQDPIFVIAERWRALWRRVEWISDREIFTMHGDDWRIDPC